MGIFSLPVEPTRCSDSLLWFAPPPWSPLRPIPCSLVLATPASATPVLVTLALPSPPPLLPSASPPPASTPPTSPSPAMSELFTLPLPSLPLPLLPPLSPPLVSLEATQPSEDSTARGRLMPSP